MFLSLIYYTASHSSVSFRTQYYRCTANQPSFSLTHRALFPLSSTSVNFIFQTNFLLNAIYTSSNRNPIKFVFQLFLPSIASLSLFLSLSLSLYLYPFYLLLLFLFLSLHHNSSTSAFTFSSKSN